MDEQEPTQAEADQVAEPIGSGRPDGFDFRKDGTILAWIDDQVFRLRRPKTGEFKRLRLAVRERDDEITALQQEAADSTTPAGPDPSEAEAAALIHAAREASRLLADRQEELDKGWILLAFNGNGDARGLSDRRLPDDFDEWPVWLWQAANIGSFLNHWLNVPLARGPQ